MKKTFTFDNETKTVFVIFSGKVNNYTLQPNEWYNDMNKHIFRMTEEGALEMKFCPYCSKWEPISNFYKNRKSSDGYAGKCIKCTNEKLHIPESINYSDTENNATVYGSTDMGNPQWGDIMGRPFDAKPISMPVSYGVPVPAYSNHLDSVISMLVAEKKESSALIEKQLSTINEQLVKINEQEATIKELTNKLTPIEGKTIQELTEEELRNFLMSGKVDKKILFDAVVFGKEKFECGGTFADTGEKVGLLFKDKTIQIVFPKRIHELINPKSCVESEKIIPIHSGT